MLATLAEFPSGLLSTGVGTHEERTPLYLKVMNIHGGGEGHWLGSGGDLVADAVTWQDGEQE